MPCKHSGLGQYGIVASSTSGTAGFIMRPAEKGQEHIKYKKDSVGGLEATRSLNENKLQLIVGRLKDFFLEKMWCHL